MIFTSNLIKCILIVTLLVLCQMQLTSAGNNYELNDLDLGDDLYEASPMQHPHLRRQNYRRASLRYHPHVLYKKASLRPIIGQNGKITFIE
ncbi:unnamed protein product [Rotaria socialis]|uniref:Uncharacterized protein n=1 Tax=Rotaria socialis TaxID=392032 RepID=A0A820YBB0_9BILA|nr:unnamed protein product [Rotaria socialis]CAF3375721.1 unnamed protein product [Rotaria socialis]CAF3502180.1 unnamed protein product [Rotaria socialis]CAF3639002.1 unnamed protein product [Rotaria socialis]CAF3697263.1 unnamed protein product [Rotaria socialis]